MIVRSNREKCQVPGCNGLAENGFIICNAHFEPFGQVYKLLIVTNLQSDSLIATILEEISDTL